MQMSINREKEKLQGCRPNMKIIFVEIRRSWDHLIFIIELSTQKDCLYKTGPDLYLILSDLFMCLVTKIRVNITYGTRNSNQTCAWCVKQTQVYVPVGFITQLRSTSTNRD